MRILLIDRKGFQEHTTWFGDRLPLEVRVPVRASVFKGIFQSTDDEFAREVGVRVEDDCPKPNFEIAVFQYYGLGPDDVPIFREV